VSGLSPVIITVRIPIERSWSKRSLIPSFTTSFSSMTPSASAPSATTSGVAPDEATLSTISSSSGGTAPPCSATQRRTASAARPDIASTLRWTIQSIPAIPMALSSAPMVVGIRQTSSETSVTTDTVVCA
jgi:hypothetical protein